MSLFRFKHFEIFQGNAPLKVGTDAMILGALAQFQTNATILDIGSGTGVLALMQAQKVPKATIDAIELNNDAYRDAQFNFSNSPFENVGEVVQGDFLTFQPSKKYSGFISNPPFYVNALKGAQDGLNLAKHVDELSLEQMVEKASSIAEEKASFWLIWPYQDRSIMYEAFAKNAWSLIAETTLYGKSNCPSRVVANFKLEQTPSTTKEKRELTIRDAAGRYSSEYIELTRNFHDRDLSTI